MLKKLLVLLIAFQLVFPIVAYSAKVTSSQSNFTSGELSPKVKGRYDIARYANAAATLENFLIMPAGGITHRPGTKFVGEVKDSSLPTRIIPFVFSTSQTYIIEMGNGYMRFYTNNGRVVETAKDITAATKANPVVITTSTGHVYSNGDWIVISGVGGMTELNGKTYVVANKTVDTFQLNDVDGATINGEGYATYTSGGKSARVYELTTTDYDSSIVPDVQYAQSADILYLVHKNVSPKELVRTANTSWAFNSTSFLGGPFLDDNVTAVTITPSADTGNDITLTASSAIFTSNHVTSIWKIKSGIVDIDGGNFSTTLTGDVMANQDGTAGSLATGPAATTDWAEGAWSQVQGYPASVSFHEQRLVYAGATNSPQTFWGSYIRVFDDFFAGVGDSDSYRFTIATEQVNAIRWLSSGAGSLQIGTFGGTFSAHSGTDTVPISPTNIRIDRDTTYGVADIPAKRIGNFVYYVQRNEDQIRELGFDFDIDAQKATDITLLADHILRDGDGAIGMDYQQSPYNMLWVPRDDGQIAVLTRDEGEQTLGWSRQIIGGSYNQTSAGTAQVESIAVIPGLTGEDQVWMIVKRTIDGVTRQYIEYVMPHDYDDSDDIFFVDSGLSWDNPNTISAVTKTDPVSITALGHDLNTGDQIKIVDVIGMTELNGETFLVKADYSVNTFDITTLAGVDVDGTDYTTYLVGGEAREMINSVSGLEHLEGETVSIVAEGVIVDDEVVSSGAVTLDSKAAKIHIGLYSNANIKGLPLHDGSPLGTGRRKNRRIYLGNVLSYDTTGGLFGKEDDLFTLDDEIAFPGGWDKEGEYYIRQDEPYPMTILGVILDSEVNE